MSDDEPDFGLLMPFVVCTSGGGPYEDGPFVAGYRLGLLDGFLEHGRPDVHELMVQSADVPQVDLIAMRHGYTMTSAPAGYEDEWVCVELRITPPAAG